MPAYPSGDTDMSATLITTEWGTSSLNSYQLKSVYPNLYSSTTVPNYQGGPGGLTEEQLEWTQTVAGTTPAYLAGETIPNFRSLYLGEVWP